jgi:starch synthase
LPTALNDLGHDVRLIMPAYQQVKEKIGLLPSVAKLNISNLDIEILETILPGTTIPLLLVDCPTLFERKGTPYTNEQGQPWPDNAHRFALFCRAIVDVALNKAQLNWKPNILHCNDWHTGLVCPLLHSEKDRPKTIFTIHNLAYQGLFPYQTFIDLQLPEELWSYERVEYNGQLSFIKAGIVYADHVNTVSPTYAKEIQTSEYGSGLEQLLQYYSSKLSGIINGINEQEWNPETDKKIFSNYSINNIQNKLINKSSLQKQLGLPVNKDTPLFSVISRVAEQKGIDLIISILPQLVIEKAQIVILGSGDKKLEDALTSAASKYPDHINIKIGYDEVLAHKITAAADFFLMPSRYEPCGLNQMYSQRYGTIPIVRNTGGLADTVTNYSSSKDEVDSTGILFDGDKTKDFLDAIKVAFSLYVTKDVFTKVRLNGMQQNFSWHNSAIKYMNLYLR